MSGLIEFLHACLDEDERVAREMAARVVADPGSYIVLGLAHPELAAGDCPSYLGGYDPARVLAEVAAKRRILDLRDSWARQAEVAPAELAHVFEAQVSAADAIIRALAQPFADRPGFREEWRP